MHNFIWTLKFSSTVTSTVFEIKQQQYGMLQTEVPLPLKSEGLIQLLHFAMKSDVYCVIYQYCREKYLIDSE